MDDKYPKFQYSQFDTSNGQLVIRSDDQKEFEALTGFTIKEFITDNKINKALGVPPQPQTQPQTVVNKCDKCGANMVMGRNGKPYCKPCYIAWKSNQPKEY